MKTDLSDNGEAAFTIADVSKGMWAWPSPAGCPEGYVAIMQNLELPGGMPTSMMGDGIFNNVAYDAASTVTLHAPYTPSSGAQAVQIIATSTGKVFKLSGVTVTPLRLGLSTAAGIWWSHEQYGTDLFITNATDGVYRYDNSTLVPIGAKPITACESTTDWTNATSDAADYVEGAASNKVQSGNPGASAVMTYNPATAIDTATGRWGAKTYDLVKASGTDCYHFKVKFSDGVGATITAATTTFVITDTAGKSLTWDATKWHATKSASGAAIALNVNTWQDVYCFPSDATEAATFNPTIVDSLAWKVTTSAGQTYIAIDDVYSLYLQTMPACSIVKEWKNLLFGFNGDTPHFSKVAAPDEYHTLANFTIKSGGESIQGVARFFNQLTIGTDNHVGTLSGSIVGQAYPAYLFDYNEVTDEMGIGSHRSIVKANNALYWYWKNHICIYNGTSVEHASYPVSTLLDGVDNAKDQFIVGDAFRGKHEIWWTYRRSGQAVNDRILKYDFQWSAFITVVGITTPTVLRFLSSGVEKLLTINETTRKVYAQDDSANLTFSGTAVEYALEFPAMNIPGVSLEWMLTWLQYLQNTGNVVVQYRQGDTLRELEQASYTTAETVAMNADGEYGKNRIGERASWLQVKLTASGAYVELQPPFIVVGRALQAPWVRVTP